QALILKVLKPGAPPPQAIASGQQLAFLKLVVPKKEVYVGELLPAQFELYLHERVQNASGFQTTSFPADGFTVGQWIQGPQRQEQIGNSVYRVVSLPFPLRAIKTGSFNLGPVTATLVVDLPSPN